MTKEELLEKKISAISLGCDKNRVDLEKMLFLLKDKGFKIVENVDDANIVIVNTCAFIQPAKEEAISNIIEMEFLKRKEKIEKLIVTGCLNERNYDDLKPNFPDVDAFVKIKDNDKINNIIEELYGLEKSSLEPKNGRVLTTSPSYAFLKIADGCNNGCAYCAIPRIRGRYISEREENLQKEAETLVKQGVKEIVVVAQDVTRYGEDLYNDNMLIPLLKKLIKIKNLKWIRLHYLYPEKMTDELLEFITTQEKICNYIDMPLQHIDDNVLNNMRRRLNEKNTRELIEKIKINYPQITLRTTFIVGFPGETRKAFKKLCDFVENTKFDCAGFFPYFKEENTSAFYMKNQISKFVKKSRLKKLQKIQQNVIINQAKQMLEKEFQALIDGFDYDTGDFFGHLQNFSPKVDFGLKIEGKNLQTGDIVKVKITGFDGENYKGVRI